MKKGAAPWLCIVADRASATTDTTFLSTIDSALVGGVDAIVLVHNRCASRGEFCKLASSVASLCNNHHASLLLRDHAECVAEVGASGVELSNPNPQTFRAAQGHLRGIPGVLIGGLVQLVQLLRSGDSPLLELPFNFVTVGPIFPRDPLQSLRTDAAVERESKMLCALEQLSRRTLIPIGVVGGINRMNIDRVAGCSTDLIVIDDEIWGSGDPKGAARGLKKIVLSTFRRRNTNPSLIRSKL